MEGAGFGGWPWVRWLLLGLWLWGCGALCQAAPAADDAPANPTAVRVQLAWLPANEAGLEIGDVSTSAWTARFVPLKSQSLDLGFNDRPIWVKVVLTTAQAQEVWLELSNPVIEQVQLYENNNQNGHWAPASARDLATDNAQGARTRRHTFALWLEAHQVKTVFLKLQSRTSLSTSVSVHPPGALIAANERESFVLGVVLGAYLLVVIFYAVFWAFTQQKTHLYYTLYIASNLAAAIFSGGWNHTLGLPPGMAEQSHALGVAISLPILFWAIFSIHYLQLQSSWPRTSRLFLLFCLASALGMITVAWLGHYNRAAVYFQMMTIGLILFNTTVLVALSRQGQQAAKLMLYAFTIFHLGIVWRYLRNLGVLESNVWNDNAYQVGAFVHMMVMSLGLFSSYSQLQKRSRELKARADAETALLHRQSQFLNLVSHEIRTPLAVILACTDNIQSRRDLEEALQARVQKIQRSVEKIEQIFSNYLDSAQLLNGQVPFQMQTMDLSALCLHVVRDVQDNGAMAMATDIEPGVQIHADAGLIGIALRNLLDNAVKYSGNQGLIRVALHTDGAMAQLEVFDSGPGIDPQDLPHIFESYYRGKNAQGHAGLGLGLNLVQYIVQQHAGHITARANPQGGMVFGIHLPMATPPALASSVVHQHHAA